jgi:hypothetical protein
MWAIQMQMDDERWVGLRGGYRVPYDPRHAIDRLAAGDAAAAWKELWQELHHQGDVDEASYAALPELVRVYEARGVPDWNIYAVAATIEEARRNGRNPPVPDWLLAAYEAAWRKLERLALAEFPDATAEDLIQSIIAVMAFAKGLTTLGRMAMLTEDERTEMLAEAGWG